MYKYHVTNHRVLEFNLEHLKISQICQIHLPDSKLLTRCGVLHYTLSQVILLVVFIFHIGKSLQNPVLSTSGQINLKEAQNHPIEMNKLRTVKVKSCPNYFYIPHNHLFIISMSSITICLVLKQQLFMKLWPKHFSHSKLNLPHLGCQKQKSANKILLNKHFKIVNTIVKYYI